MPDDVATLETQRSKLLEEFLRLGDLRPGSITAVTRRCGKPSGHSTRSVFDRYNIVDETDLAEATRKIEARNQASISAEETHTRLEHANVRVS